MTEDQLESLKMAVNNSVSLIARAERNREFREDKMREYEKMIRIWNGYAGGSFRDGKVILSGMNESKPIYIKDAEIGDLLRKVIDRFHEEIDKLDKEFEEL